MKRTPLVQYQQLSLTPDTIEALRHLNTRAVELGNFHISIQGFGRDKHGWENKEWHKHTGGQPWLSLVPAGRQVYFYPKFKDDDSQWSHAKESNELATLWGLAVPCGFTPWCRYPVIDAFDQHHLFTFLGPWQTLYDHLIGEGRGEAAWPSVCCAAQVDVGAWEGDHPVERFVQAQLHRLGVSVGVIDGKVGKRTLLGLKRIGLSGHSITEAAEILAKTDRTPKSKVERKVGHVVLPGQNLSIVTTGEVKSTKTPQGAAITVDGPGRVIVDIIPKD